MITLDKTIHIRTSSDIYNYVQEYAKQLDMPLNRVAGMVLALGVLPLRLAMDAAKTEVREVPNGNLSSGEHHTHLLDSDGDSHSR